MDESLRFVFQAPVDADLTAVQTPRAPAHDPIEWFSVRSDPAVLLDVFVEIARHRVLPHAPHRDGTTCAVSFTFGLPFGLPLEFAI
jgi:hypothetical protein